MPITLVVNSIPFSYPTAGDSPGWGGPATDWATEVTFVLNDLVGPNDFTQTTFPLANNIGTFTNISAFTFNTGLVRSAIIEYSIYRTSTANPSGHSESGTLSIVYDNNAAPGSKWSMIGYGINGNSGTTFSITDAGQVQYKTTDIGTLGYSAVLRFRARTMGQ